jgi:hypothetical protein
VINTDKPYVGWALLELMGHRVRAGHVHQVEQYGVTQLRIDIPAYGEEGELAGEVTEYYGGAAIYALSPCDEEVARHHARRLGDPLPARPRSFVGAPAIQHRSAGDDDDSAVEFELEFDDELTGDPR